MSKTLNELLDKVEEMHPTTCVHAEDGRYTYPAQFKALREIAGDMVLMVKLDGGYKYVAVEEEKK